MNFFFFRVFYFNDTHTPKYINQVRSPFDRFVSNYNYMRFKSYHPNITPKDFKKLVSAMGLYNFLQEKQPVENLRKTSVVS